MRPVLPLLLLVSVLPACSCSKSGADVPTPVTLRFTNTSSTPLFVDATGAVVGDGGAGLDPTWGMGVLPQGSTADAVPFFDTLPTVCACLNCDQVCNSGGCGTLTCAPGQPTDPMAEKLAPNDVREWTWTGVYYAQSSESCGSLVGGQPCLQHTNDFPDDTFQARICYALSVVGGQGVDAGQPFPASLPPAGELVCVTKDFQPQDGTVQLAPPPPVPCGGDAGPSPCGPGQLCFAGVCTSGCPANDFPDYGNGYYVNVSAPSGPFFTRTDTSTSTTWTGTGTVTSANYTGTTFLAVTRSPSLSGTLDFTLPQLGTDCCQAAFSPGDTVQILVVESPPNSANRALAIRDGTGQLLQVADMATNGVILGPSDTAPFTVDPQSTAEGCSSVGSTCKALFAATRFTTPDGLAPVLAPGQSVTLATSGANFHVGNVENVSYLVTVDGGTCASSTPLFPYVISNAQP